MMTIGIRHTPYRTRLSALVSILGIILFPNLSLVAEQACPISPSSMERTSASIEILDPVYSRTDTCPKIEALGPLGLCTQGLNPPETMWVRHKVWIEHLTQFHMVDDMEKENWENEHAIGTETNPPLIEIEDVPFKLNIRDSYGQWLPVPGDNSVEGTFLTGDSVCFRLEWCTSTLESFLEQRAEENSQNGQGWSANSWEWEELPVDLELEVIKPPIRDTRGYFEPQEYRPSPGRSCNSSDWWQTKHSTLGDISVVLGTASDGTPVYDYSSEKIDYPVHIEPHLWNCRCAQSPDPPHEWFCNCQEWEWWTTDVLPATDRSPPLSYLDNEEHWSILEEAFRRKEDYYRESPWRFWQAENGTWMRQRHNPGSYRFRINIGAAFSGGSYLDEGPLKGGPSEWELIDWTHKIELSGGAQRSGSIIGHEMGHSYHRVLKPDLQRSSYTDCGSQFEWNMDSEECRDVALYEAIAEFFELHSYSRCDKYEEFWSCRLNVYPEDLESSNTCSPMQETRSEDSPLIHWQHTSDVGNGIARVRNNRRLLCDLVDFAHRKNRVTSPPTYLDYALPFGCMSTEDGPQCEEILEDRVRYDYQQVVTAIRGMESYKGDVIDLLNTLTDEDVTVETPETSRIRNLLRMNFIEP